MNGERKEHFFQEGEVLQQLLHKGGIRENTAQKRTQETSEGNTHKDERGAERDVPVIGNLGDDGLGNTERAVCQSMNQTDAETYVIVLTQSKSKDA